MARSVTLCFFRLVAGPLLAAVCLGRSLAADEGMWLFNEPPRGRLEQEHGFTPSEGWFDRLQRAAVRFNSGGSGAFVSADGLVLTNHHVAASSLQKLSSPDRNLARDGFLAGSREAELRCLDLELNVLMSIEDVTARVQAAVAGAADAAAAAGARREVLAAIEKESLAATGLRSDVITLFGGGTYHLYRFRRYTDVRLVFAPEREIAFYGGDADNFEYPRHCLDICFFRVYEDGRPAQVADYLPWAGQDVAAGDLIFVAGHPGHTDRGKTLAELTAMRDRQLPFVMEWLNRREVLLRAYSEEGRVEAQQAMQDLFGTQNGRKARGGLLAALLRPDVFNRLAATEARLQAAWQGDADASPWERIAAAQQTSDAVALRYNLLEGGMGCSQSEAHISSNGIQSPTSSVIHFKDQLQLFYAKGVFQLEPRNKKKCPRDVGISSQQTSLHLPKESTSFISRREELYSLRWNGHMPLEPMNSSDIARKRRQSKRIRTLKAKGLVSTQFSSDDPVVFVD